jgi:hypothetical protein
MPSDSLVQAWQEAHLHLLLTSAVTSPDISHVYMHWASDGQRLSLFFINYYIVDFLLLLIFIFIYYILLIRGLAWSLAIMCNGLND